MRICSIGYRGNVHKCVRFDGIIYDVDAKFVDKNVFKLLCWILINSTNLILVCMYFKMHAHLSNGITMGNREANGLDQEMKIFKS